MRSSRFQKPFNVICTRNNRVICRAGSIAVHDVVSLGHPSTNGSRRNRCQSCGSTKRPLYNPRRHDDVTKTVLWEVVDEASAQELLQGPRPSRMDRTMRVFPKMHCHIESRNEGCGIHVRNIMGTGSQHSMQNVSSQEVN